MANLANQPISDKKGLDGRALLGQPSKGHPCRILILFPQYSTTLSAPHIKKLGTYFALFKNFPMLKISPLMYYVSIGKTLLLLKLNCLIAFKE